MFFTKKKKSKDISEKELLQKGLGFFTWIQEFSKKIVVIAFFIYILMDIVSLIMVIISYKQTGDLMFIDTIIMEANQTFRDVIGGYILKAATENIGKGLCMVIEKYIGFKEKEFDYLTTGDEDQTYEEDEDPQINDDYEENRSIVVQSLK